MKTLEQEAEEYFKNDSGIASHYELDTFEEFIKVMANASADFYKHQLSKLWHDVSERIKIMEDKSGVEGCTYGDTEHDSISVQYGYNLALEDVAKLLSNLKPKEE